MYKYINISILFLSFLAKVKIVFFFLLLLLFISDYILIIISINWKHHNLLKKLYIQIFESH